MGGRLPAVRAAACVGLAAVTFLLTIWIVVPPYAAVLLYPAVAVPELAAWVLAFALLTALAALVDVRVSRAARLGLLLSGATAALALTPLVRANLAAPRLDSAMRGGFGEHFLHGVPPSIQQAMRRRPIVAADLFRGIAAGDEQVTRGIEFGTPEGVSLRLDVHLPPTAGLHPVIVQIYGGSWQRGQPGDNAAFARYFAARGYAVFAIDYRHAPRWRWPAQIDDVRAALTWIRAHGGEYGADVSRIALVGRSAGAHLALLAAYMPGGTAIRGVVNYYGPTDLLEGYRDPPRPDPIGIRAVIEAFIGGTPGTLPGIYRDVSPVTYATRRQPPTLLVYGLRDHIVSPRFGATLHERLVAAGTRSALLELPWAEHAFDAITFGPGAQLALYHTERFLAWALAPQVDSRRAVPE